MLRKILPAFVVLFMAGLVFAAPAHAQQKLNLTLGYFAVRGEDARVGGDVLVADLSDSEPLAFLIKDFNRATVGGEWLFPIGDFLDGGVGVAFYQRTVPSVYANVVNANGAEIQQDLKLRIVPITGTIRFLPLGRYASVQPYIGAGIAILPWRYSETGEFVDTADYSIYRASYVDSGTAVGPVIVGGVTFPLGDTFGLGGEIRYQRGDGKLSTDFLGDRIDLTGLTYQAVFQIKFGRR